MTPVRWFRHRTLCIAAYLGVMAIGAWALTMPLAWAFEGMTGTDSRWGLGSVVCVAIFMSLHVLFLWPIRRPSAADHRRPLWTSLVAAGGLIAALVAGAAGAVAHAFANFTAWDSHPWLFIMVGLIGASWAVSTLLMVYFIRPGKPEHTLRRIASRLFVGTIIEAAAIIPLDVLIRRKDDCICATGSFFALILCAAVGFFVLGPIVFLPVIARRRRRWYAGKCDVCGYDMSTTPTLDRCPECGAGWRRA